MEIMPVLLVDGYKTSHIFQYPSDTTHVYSNLTPRNTRRGDTTEGDGVVFFGLQYFIREYLIRQFNENFFARNRNDVVIEYERRLTNYLGPGWGNAQHIGALHRLGYLPLEIKALPEGTLTPYGVPVLTLTNTHPDFFWLTNMLETLLSSVLWKASTSATTALAYRRVFEEYAEATGSDPAFVDWQGHDFSFRGMCGVEDAAVSGAAHLLSFTGTDTIPAIEFLERYYDANADNELVGGSVAATEHSVMCMGEPDGERDTFHRLITECYPTGIVSVVSDTWDLWRVLTGYLPSLRDEVLARDGKLVIRPDSGDPVNIVCGDPNADPDTPEGLGVVQLLWECFGGTVTDTGHRMLDSHVGVIYGDGISPERQRDMLHRLSQKRFASGNVVLGLGSYCVAPETPVLCADLVWRAAGSLTEGMEILSFDEDGSYGEGSKAARRYQVAEVLHNAPAVKEAARVYTDRGDPITASLDHPWLVWSERGMTRPGSGRLLPGLHWKETMDLLPGDRLAFFGRPWETDNSRAGGWLAGIFDGEGSLSQGREEGRLIPSWKLNISQNPGPVLDRIRREFSERGFSYYMNERRCPQVVLTGGWLELIRFMGTVRPERLMAKLPKLLVDSPALFRGRTYSLATVSDVVRVGPSPVASIRTSSATFITGGYLSHNTYQYVTRDTDGWAVKATAGITKSRGLVEIFKDPITDDGGKRSARGLLCVDYDDAGVLRLEQRVSPERESEGQLRTVFRDGEQMHPQTLAGIRARVASHR